jgi:endonuclease VIII
LISACSRDRAALGQALRHSGRVPEGDIVWRVAQRLDAALSGRMLTLSDLRWPSLATVDLTGRQVAGVMSRGKHILVRVEAADPEPALTLHSHLRMDGSWHVHRTGERWEQGRGQGDVRAILANDTWTALGHRLGILDLVPTADEERLVGHLGPDLLGADWNAEEAVRRLRREPQRALGEALLDQGNLAGIGTFFMAETLFLRGITPWTPVREVADLDAVVTLAHRLLHASRAYGSQVTTGDTRPGRTNYVHARSGRPCLRCGTTVRVASIGTAPRDRVAFYCPRCQQGPAPTDGRTQRPLGAGRRTP